MDDTAPELRPRGEFVVDMERIRVAGDLDEPPDVLVREGLGEAGMLPDLEVFDSGDDRRVRHGFPCCHPPRTTDQT